MAPMGRRISVFLDEDVIHALNAHTQASPLSRSELVGVALRRFLREERRHAPTPPPSAQLARRIAAGELPSEPVDGHSVSADRVPWAN